ncbi:chromate transporter [uncultured Paenibacillus sp.]|uniref:chromate transporter n=1 Tax=uncultured Paenibacillus sp. TaxID=227322 RepID=UPI0015A7CE78|nr:chromate transporter [uncultured Paenibacillus sp.]
MDWLELLFGFLIANLLGYGGGPSSIPLMYEEIVPHYHWLSDAEFSNMLALGNALPGPIATKIAAYVGYEVGGWVGLGLALLATVLPSAAGLILLLRLLAKYRQSNIVKGMTLLVQPVIAIMMVTLTWKMAIEPFTAIGIWQTLAIAVIAFWAMERRKIHPALVIVAAFIYGGVVLQHYV